VPITQWQADDELNFVLRGIAWALPDPLWLSLHSADPGYTGDQTTNEVNYFGYRRINLPRAPAPWAAPAAGPPGVRVVTLADTHDWPHTTNPFALPAAWAFVGIGDSFSGPGRLRFRCPVGPFTINLGDTPRLVAGSQLFLCNC